MYLDYSKITVDTDGTPIHPELRLQTLSGRNFGTLRGVHDLKFNINYSELSEISFTIPFMIEGIINPLYDKVVGYKVVWTEKYGQYLLTTPTITGTGLEEKKTVKGYSLEKRFERKNLFLAEGVYNFYDSLNPTDTILGRIIELDSDWEIGDVSPSLEGRYRTLTQYDGNALSFMYGDAMTKYRCVFVFDPYRNPETGKRRIYVYDADADISTLPIYLSYDNLLEQAEVTELSDELITQLSVYGADNLSIASVNPIGSDHIVNLDYFIENGDIPHDLALKVKEWQSGIEANRLYYTNLVSMRSSATARKIALQAELVDLKNERDSLINQQSICISALAKEPDNEDRQNDLDEINKKIYGVVESLDGSEVIVSKGIEHNISDKEAEIDGVTQEITSYTDSILGITNDWSYKNYFRNKDEGSDIDERLILDQYLIQDSVVESSFVATSVDTSIVEAEKTTKISGTVNISGAEISGTDLSTYHNKVVYSISGGNLSIGEISLASKIIRGTLEINEDNQFVFSGYLGTCIYGDNTYQSGLFTLSGELSEFSSDVQTQVGFFHTMTGTKLSFVTEDALRFITTNVTDYQKYSVAQELYEYGQQILAERAFPTYEFTIDAANFLFQKEFEVFKDSLQFGHGIYLMLGSMGRVIATFIGLELDFSNTPSIGLTFANRFQRHDGKTYLKELLDKTSSASRSFDASRYLYNQAALKSSQVSQFMNSTLDAAVNNIIAASDQSVVLDGTGIHIGEQGSTHQMRITKDMIAVTDDNWNNARLAIGVLPVDDGNGGTVNRSVVNAEVVSGKLVIGNSLVMENIKTIAEGANTTEVVQFKFDSTGAWLNNATMVIQGLGNSILISPRYGIIAGTNEMITIDGTEVNPIFEDEYGIITDDDNMPIETNFYLGTDGKAYFRGELIAKSGKIGGFTIENDFLHGGFGDSYVALNGSSTGSNSDYAMWAGDSNPDDAAFSVMKNGTVKASGTINATGLQINGKDALTTDKLINHDVLNLKGLTITNGSEITFKIDPDGNVTVKGNITMSGDSSITWESIGGNFDAYFESTNSYDLTREAIDTASDAEDAANSVKGIVDMFIGNEEWDGKTYIDGTCLATGTVIASNLIGERVWLYSEDFGGESGYISLSDAQTADYAVDFVSNGAMRVVADNGSLFLQSGFNGLYLQITDNFAFNGDLISDDSEATIGYSNARWAGIYLRSSPNVSSDIRQKKDIERLSVQYTKFFDLLRPSKYKMIDDASDQYHVGFIAQEVEEAMHECGMDELDFGGLSIDKEHDVYMLRYEEFIGILVAKVQDLEKRLAQYIERQEVTA